MISEIEKKNQLNFVVSYMNLRRFIGFAGVLLPWVLVVGSHYFGQEKSFQPSISDFYYTEIGEVFVFVMVILGTFLFTYKGQFRWENILSSIAGFCAVLVAFFPTAATHKTQESSCHFLHTKVPQLPIGSIEFHLIFAGLFFIVLAIVSIFFFTKADNPNVKDLRLIRQKKRRNILYVICGIVMIVSIATIAVHFIMNPEVNPDSRFVFCGETIAVTAFGVSWLTKGHTFFPDEKHFILNMFK
jgi:hypothetical protein